MSAYLLTSVPDQPELLFIQSSVDCWVAFFDLTPPQQKRCYPVCLKKQVDLSSHHEVPIIHGEIQNGVERTLSFGVRADDD